MAPEAQPPSEAQLQAQRRNCQCGRNEWTVADGRYVLAEVDESNTVTGGSLPVHAQVCRWCGHVRLFHVHPSDI